MSPGLAPLFNNAKRNLLCWHSTHVELVNGCAFLFKLSALTTLIRVSASLLIPPILSPLFAPLHPHLSHHCYRCLHRDDRLPPLPPPHDLVPGWKSPQEDVARKHITAIALLAQDSPLYRPSVSLPFSSRSSFFRTLPVKLIQHPTATHPDPGTITKSTLTQAQTDPKASFAAEARRRG